MSLHILYEDEQLLVLNKAAGQLVIPGRGRLEPEPLVSQVAQYLSAKAYVVHRLDKDTSGVLLFAKDAATHRDLSIQFERREVQKTYLAVVQGNVEKNNGEIRYTLRQFGSGRMGIAPQGKPALTRYRVIKRLHHGTLLDGGIKSAYIFTPLEILC